MRSLLTAVVLVFCLVAPTLAEPRPIAPLEARVRALVAAQRGRLKAGIAIVHVEGGEQVLVDGQHTFPLASVFKLPILVELGRQLQAGALKLDQSLPIRADQKIIGSGTLRNRPDGSTVTVREAMELMETISDNTATDILFDRIGLGSVNAMMSGLGATRTDIYLTNRAAWLVCLGMGSEFHGLSASAIAAKWLGLSASARRAAAERIVAENRRTPLAAIQRAEDASASNPYADDMRLAAAVDNQASPADLALLLTTLQQGKALDDTWTRYCMGVLGRQRYNTRIPRHLPKGVRVYHKTGSIRGVVNDAGLIEVGPHNHVVVVALCSNVAQGAQDAAEELIGQVARAAYDHFR